MVEPLEKLLPGRTTQRDLIGEIADGLTGAGVKFMGLKLDVAYLIGSENMKNTLAVGLGYTIKLSHL